MCIVTGLSTKGFRPISDSFRTFLEIAHLRLNNSSSCGAMAGAPAQMPTAHLLDTNAFCPSTRAHASSSTAAHADTHTHTHGDSQRARTNAQARVGFKLSVYACREPSQRRPSLACAAGHRRCRRDPLGSAGRVLAWRRRGITPAAALSALRAPGVEGRG